MEADYFRMLFDYGYWARDRLLSVCEGLTDEEFVRPNAFTYGSLHKVLGHTLFAEGLVGSRCRGEASNEVPAAGQITSLSMLTELWQDNEGKMRAFLETLHDDGMHRMVMTRRGDLPLWQQLAHLANHSTQHRSEAAEMLTQMGRSPGDLDLMHYLFVKHEHLTDGQ